MMNANQAQAGINRLLQLGETTAPVARVERSVSKSSFDQHMKQAAAHEPPPRREPDRPRRDDRDVKASTERGTEPSPKSSKPSDEAPQETKRQEGIDKQDESAVNKASDVDVDKSVEAKGGSLTHDEGAEAPEELVGASLLNPDALIENVADKGPLAVGSENPESVTQTTDVINGGALNVDQAPLDVETAEAPIPLTGEFALSMQGGEKLGGLEASGNVLPVPPTQVSETVAAAVAPALQSKATIGLRESATAPVAGTVNAAAAADEGGAAQPVVTDQSLSSDTKTAPKTPVSSMALTGEQGVTTKANTTVTPQADQWFKQLAAEPQKPELKSAQVGAVSAGSAAAEMAKAQNRLASSLVSQGTMGPLQTQVKTPFGASQWGGAVAERVAFLASQRVTAAEIHLDPPELGPLQVRVTLNQEQASVSFVAQHAGVREALDQNAFRLREMLDSEGLDLVDVDVSDQSFAEQDSEASGGGENTGDETLSESEEQPAPVSKRLSLVDHFV